MARHSTPLSQLGFGWLALVLVLCLACGAYLNTLGNGFVLDDPHWVGIAQQLDRGTPPASAFGQPSSRGEDGAMTYCPVALHNLALDFGWWRQNASGYHQTSVLLHMVCALLVYLIVLALTRRATHSAVVAVLFAVHPLATGCVSYISNRGELLATAGALVSLGLLVTSKNWLPTETAVAGAVSLAAFGFALGAAETALVVPGLAACYLVAFERAAKWRWAWVGLLVVVALIYLIVRYRVLGGWGLPGAQPLSVGQQVVVYFRAIGAAVVALVCPWQLSLEHSLTLGPSILLWFEFVLGIATVPAGLFLLARARAGLPEVWFGTAWAGAGILSSALLVTRTGTFVEPWLYLPSIGVWLAGLALAGHFVSRSGPVAEHAKELSVAVYLVIAGLMTRTILRNADWRNEPKLLAQALASAPNSAELHLRYGQALERKGAGEQAIAQYREATRLNRNDGRAHASLAIALGEAGSLTEAVSHFREAVRCDPNNGRFHFNLAVALAKQGETGEAIAHYAAALNAPEPALDAANNLAWLLATCRRAEFRNGAQAVEIASRVMQMTNGEDPEVLDTLAAALAEAGNFPEASRVAQQAVQLASSRGNSDGAALIQSRLKLYLAGQPYHE
jgi:Flp pilus assembly protein TadD